MKIQAKILRNKELNNYDGVLTQLDTNISPRVSEKDRKAAENEDKASWYDLGFLQTKIVKNIFFCLNERQQIGKKFSSNNFISSSFTTGIFFLILIWQELMMISSDLGLYSLLFKTGFFMTHGIFLVLLKVRTLISDDKISFSTSRSAWLS